MEEDMAAFLGIDPSLVATGWILCDGDKITFGAIKTAPEQKRRGIYKSHDTTRRLEMLLAALPNLILPDGIACEQPAGAQSAAAAAALGEVHGALVGALWGKGALNRTRWIPARDGKLALTGHYSATKKVMIARAREWLYARSANTADRFNELPGYAAEAVADSLGVLLASKLLP